MSFGRAKAEAGVGILVVDDDPITCKLLSFLLSSEGYAVWTTQTPEAALTLVEEEAVELIILDILLPRLDGFELFKRLRSAGCDCPVIFLSAKGGFPDKVTGLRLGADDYVAKPFEASELLARVQAVLRRYRRSQATASTTPLKAGELALDPTELKAFLPGGREAFLTPTEMRILRCLMANCGSVVSRSVLADVLWTYPGEGTEDHIDVYVCRLRKKIEPDPSHPTLIETVRGSGYRLKVENANQR